MPKLPSFVYSRRDFECLVQCAMCNLSMNRLNFTAQVMLCAAINFWASFATAKVIFLAWNSVSSIRCYHFHLFYLI